MAKDDSNSAPTSKLVIAGADPVALALADLGFRVGWDIVLHCPRGPATIATPWEAARYHNGDADTLFRTETIDPWTAIVCTNHDLELDHSVLVHALRGPAFYVGALGSRRKVLNAKSALPPAASPPAELKRLHASVGLKIGAETPNEIAIAIWADLSSAT